MCPNQRQEDHCACFGQPFSVQIAESQLASVLQNASYALAKVARADFLKLSRALDQDAAHRCGPRGRRKCAPGPQAKQRSGVAKCCHVRAASGHLQGSIAAREIRESQCMNQGVAARLTDRCAHRPLRRPLRCRRHRSCRTLRRWICHRSRRVTVHKTNCRRLSGAPDSLVDFLTGP